MIPFTTYALATQGGLGRVKRGLQRRIRTQASVDATQNERIAKLERENQSLEVCLASLLTHLAHKGILDEEEWLSIAELTQDVQERDSLVLLTDEDEPEPPAG